ncbi:MAG: hypothetical protein FWG51_05280 [Firmicutes bacterium]|nr:hypothetical protein [Bacillota bacterium]
MGLWEEILEEWNKSDYTKFAENYSCGDVKIDELFKAAHDEAMREDFRTVFSKTMKAYEKAANKGHALAQFELANIFLATDEKWMTKQAKKLLEKAAAAGVEQAKITLKHLI